MAGAIYSMVQGRPSGPLKQADAACNATGLSCNILAGILGPILSLALASGVFLLVRLWLVSRPYVRRAREQPQHVVETAGTIFGEVVGRDELCHVMIEDLRDRGSRRPHVVIGGVGTGKTALLVRLTKLLAERGAVPVPIRLRDAQDSLDFRELARRRFVADADTSLLSDAEGEKAWRELCKSDKVVVLADGLEEALIEGNAQKERDNLIRLAIRRANQHQLPLVIASRPHDPLRDMEAAIVELEPLSEEAALEYVQRRDGRQDDRRLDWVVETADVAESPLYLQITRQLHRAGLMEYVTGRQDGRRLDTRGVDRAELRLRLLDTWTQALIDGYFPAGLPLSREDRMAAVEQLSLMACVGLRQDRLQVRFDDAEHMRAQRKIPIITEVDRRLEGLGRRFDLRLAATWGAQLGLVEARGDGVRFPHSVMQAYLGSRLIDAAMADKGYRADALKKSGNELLIALVTHSRARGGPAGADRLAPADDARRNNPGPSPLGLLLDEAGRRRDVKVLYLYAAALQIDCVGARPAHGDIATDIAGLWPDVWARDQRTLEEAKLNLVRRFAEAARAISDRRRTQAGDRAGPAYRQLYDISLAESSYPIRLAATQEIGGSGDEAFNALEGVLGPPGGLADGSGDGRTAVLPGAAAGGGGGRGSSKGRSKGRSNSAGTRPGQPAPQDEQEREDRAWREGVARAWLAPLLVGSATGESREARRNLERWLQYVSEHTGTRAEADLRLSLEVALSQGFKHAANRRRRHPHAQPEARAYLAERAREMLRNSGFWFTRLNLVHALCLWSLPDAPGAQSPGGPHTDHRVLVEHWVAAESGQPEHPFVVEARKLAVRALETGQPERFIWIDAAGVTAKIGSLPSNPRAARKHNLWIPPSTGWTALHPRAQKLVADVMLLLNLAERGPLPSDRSRRLRRTNRADLPPCLAGDRSPLDPTRTVGMAETSEPGSNCTHGCRFELCPYPPRGEANYRVELSEAFCRRQQALVTYGLSRRRTTPWQEALASDLRQFWKRMGTRSHPAEIGGEPDGEPVIRLIRRS